MALIPSSTHAATGSTSWGLLKLFRSERPLIFFGGIGLLLAIASIMLAIPICATYMEEGLVPRLPTAMLSTGRMLLALMLVTSALVLDTVTRGRHEAPRLPRTEYNLVKTREIVRSNSPPPVPRDL